MPDFELKSVSISIDLPFLIKNHFMKSLIRLTLIAVSAMFILASCSKDEEEVSKTRTELLTQADWKIVSDMNKSGSDPWNDEISSYDACELDNYLSFKIDHTAVYDEGATKCDPSDPQIESGVWAFTDNDTRINLNGASFTLDELSATTLTISFSYTYNGVTEYIKQTYKH